MPDCCSTEPASAPLPCSTITSGQGSGNEDELRRIFGGTCTRNVRVSAPTVVACADVPSDHTPLSPAAVGPSIEQARADTSATLAATFAAPCRTHHFQDTFRRLIEIPPRSRSFPALASAAEFQRERSPDLDRSTRDEDALHSKIYPERRRDGPRDRRAEHGEEAAF